MSARTVTPPKNGRSWDPEVTTVTIISDEGKEDGYKVYRNGIQIGFVFATMSSLDKDRFASRPGTYSNLGKERRFWILEPFGGQPDYRSKMTTRVAAIAELVERTA